MYESSGDNPTIQNDLNSEKAYVAKSTFQCLMVNPLMHGKDQNWIFYHSNSHLFTVAEFISL